MRRLAAPAAALLLAGCIREHRPWKPVDGTYEWSTGWFGSSFKIDLPEGWMAATEMEGLVASRDGFTLQQIKVARFEAGKPLPNTKKTFVATMLPQEIAEVLVDDVRSDGAVKGLKVVETKPATLSGQRGFRILLSFRDVDGMKMKAAVAGVLVGKNVWRVVYVAPERHYFDLDLATFDQALATFRVKD
jgi:hypothetical protein